MARLIKTVPDFEGFRQMANLMLRTLEDNFAEGTEESMHKTLAGVLDIHRYLFNNGYYYNEEHNAIERKTTEMLRDELKREVVYFTMNSSLWDWYDLCDACDVTDFDDQRDNVEASLMKTEWPTMVDGMEQKLAEVEDDGDFDREDVEDLRNLIKRAHNLGL